MMKNLTLTAFAMIVFLATGIQSCATSEQITGNPIDETAVAKIVDGKTTQDEIINWFGAPTSTSQLGDNVLYIYRYCKTSGSGLYTGYFGQTKTEEKCNELTITFDKDKGTVKTHRYQKVF